MHNFAADKIMCDISMCQTEQITKHISQVGRHSFDRRLRLASPFFVERHGEIGRILNSVDKLTRQLHADFTTITEEDYKSFGAELKIVIATLKALYRESRSHKDMQADNERLRQQIADLEEIDHDIRVFRINAPKNMQLQNAMQQLGTLDFSSIIAHQ